MKAGTPLIFTIEDGGICSSCGSGEYVLSTQVKQFPEICVLCLMRMIDIPMEWRLSKVAMQTIAHRKHSLAIAAEQDKMERALPPELRRKRAKG